MVKLISTTPDAERTMVYCARVSSKNQDNPNIEKLLKYCLDHGHVSVFEHAHMTVEIETSRAISAQILRHRSFTFQEFSQRYAEVTEFKTYEARSQDSKNRQNSNDDMSDFEKAWFGFSQSKVQRFCKEQYDLAISKGIAKEQARFLLPMSTTTKLYMTGSVRSWIHYLETRTHESTQKEHRIIAQKIKDIFVKEFPIISRSLEWINK